MTTNVYVVWSGGDNAGTGQPLANVAAADATAWSHAYQNMGTLLAGQAVAGGDTILIHNAHVGVGVAAGNGTAATVTYTLPETGSGFVTILCVDKATNAVSEGGIESTNGNFHFVFATPATAPPDLGFYFQGMEFKSGSGSASACVFDILSSSTYSGHGIFSNCKFMLNSTGSANKFNMGPTSGVLNKTRLDFYNCQFSVGHAAQYIASAGTNVRFYGCKFYGATSPTSVFRSSQDAHMGTIESYGCDWSGGSATNLVDVSTASGNGQNHYKFAHCVTPATLVTGTHPGYSGSTVEVINSAAAGGVFVRYYRLDTMGVVSTSTAEYKTSGSAGLGSTGSAVPYSYVLDSGTRCSVYTPLYTPWIAVEIGTTGSKTVSLKFADAEGGAVLTSQQLAIEVMCMGDAANVATSPQAPLYGSYPLVSGTIFRDPLAAGSALTDTADDSNWTHGALTPTHTYTISKTVTLDYAGYIYVRGVLSADVGLVYMDGLITVA